VRLSDVLVPIAGFLPTFLDEPAPFNCRDEPDDLPIGREVTLVLVPVPALHLALEAALDVLVIVDIELPADVPDQSLLAVDLRTS
jgi:hypothetical protein